MSGPTDAEIIAAFEAAEKSAGGPSMTEAKSILHHVARRLGITYERARDVLLHAWGAGSGG